MTDQQWQAIRAAVLNECWHLLEDASDPDATADAIMAIVQRELAE